jgi:ATP-dependent 26S proteasome regulatory subunit
MRLDGKVGLPNVIVHVFLTYNENTLEILQVHLKGEAFPEVQLDDIARKTDGYSGSDLKSQDVVCICSAKSNNQLNL